MNEKTSASKKALLIGAAGFVGSYLINHLQEHLGWKVAATKLRHESWLDKTVVVYDVDILQQIELEKVLAKEKPDYVFHLAAQSSVGLSWKNPSLTVEVNVQGTLNVLEAVRNICPATSVLLPGSSEEYGAVQPEDNPVKEETLPRPGNVYAITKNTQNQLARVYAKAYGLQVVSTRSFNHIGPRQLTGFVLPDFCKQVAEIEAGQKPPVLSVGNLEAKRDFCDVRDIVAAYSLLIQDGKAGETYNVGSGRAVSIRSILNKTLSYAKVPILVEPDPARMRPSDVPEVWGDISKLRNLTGWAPQIPIETTIQETLAYWRRELTRV